MPKLSILIPYLEKRDKENLALLIMEIQSQCKIGQEVEVILMGDNGEKPTGTKRNELVALAKANYVWFVDADDMILPGAIEAILNAIESSPDCLAINGYMTTNGTNRVNWFISKDNPYQTAALNGRIVYLRWTNHITPIKTEIAKQIKFPDIYYKEDYEWSLKLKESGLLKTEVWVNIPVYHYNYKSKK
jgi:glycosyltransferase involved in cell wall biosynthesis